MPMVSFRIHQTVRGLEFPPFDLVLIRVTLGQDLIHKATATMIDNVGF